MWLLGAMWESIAMFDAATLAEAASDGWGAERLL
jgi:hypothetical protein